MTATVQRLSVDAHGLTHDQVNTNALAVLESLNAAGFTALLVGGCVRDLLLGHTPKDFDVATDAKPEDVKALFRRSRLVGRRFRIAHVRSGRDLIEVSTFRRAHAAATDERSHSADGMILRDNVYGTLEEDAFRRDFTINALYYDPRTEEVIDYVGGLDDLKLKRLRFIGETQTRIREDPVRVLRALRFQAKLGFDLDPACSAAFGDAAQLLAAIPAARLFDEMLKFFLSGYAAAAWQLLAETPMRAAVFPTSIADDPMVMLAMRNTDARIAADKPVTPGFLIAVLLWPDYRKRAEEFAAEMKPAEARTLAATDTLAEQQRIIAVPRRFSQFVRDVWQMQGRLESRLARSIERVAGHPRFRAAYDFLLLRAEAADFGSVAGSGSQTAHTTDSSDSTTTAPLGELARWWTLLQEVSEEAADQMIKDLRSQQPQRKRRRRRRGRNQSGTQPDNTSQDGVECQ